MHLCFRLTILLVFVFNLLTADMEILEAREGMSGMEIIFALRRMEHEIEKVKLSNQKLEKQLTNIKAELSEYRKREDNYNACENRRALQQSAGQHKVAFSAALSVLSLNVSRHTTVIFDQVETNIGQAYNPGTGIFTCPYSGYYFFTHSALASYNGGFLETELVLDGAPKSLAYCGDRKSFTDLTDYDQGSNAVIVRCNHHQRLWVQVYNKNGSALFNQRYTQFSGFMLWEV